MKKVDDMNYYELLNIEPNANTDEVQRAYKIACETYQPDSLALYSVLSESERELMLKRIDKAYRTLINTRERAKYNQSIGIDSSTLHQEEKDSAKEKIKPASLDDPYSKLNAPKFDHHPVEEEWPEGKEPELSDPQYLKKHRERKRISLQEISEVTKISVNSLRALENGEYEKFPGRVYIVGFLRSYAEYIAIDVQQAKAHFEILYSNKSKK